MDKIFQIIDGLTPLIGPEGVLVLKIVVVFLVNYYVLVGIPVALSTWVAYKLTYK